MKGSSDKRTSRKKAVQFRNTFKCEDTAIDSIQEETHETQETQETQQAEQSADQPIEQSLKQAYGNGPEEPEEPEEPEDHDESCYDELPHKKLKIVESDLGQCEFKPPPIELSMQAVAKFEAAEKEAKEQQRQQGLQIEAEKSEEYLQIEREMKTYPVSEIQRLIYLDGIEGQVRHDLLCCWRSLAPQLSREQRRVAVDQYIGIIFES